MRGGNCLCSPYYDCFIMVCPGFGSRLVQRKRDQTSSWSCSQTDESGQVLPLTHILCQETHNTHLKYVKTCSWVTGFLHVKLHLCVCGFVHICVFRMGYFWWGTAHMAQVNTPTRWWYWNEARFTTLRYVTKATSTPLALATTTTR